MGRAPGAVTWRAGFSRPTIPIAARALAQVDHLGRGAPRGGRRRGLGHRLLARGWPCRHQDDGALRAGALRGTSSASVDGCTLTARDRARSRRDRRARHRVRSAHRGPERAAACTSPTPGCTTGAFPTQKIVSPIPNARISGPVDVEGDLGVDRWPAMVGHNWGRGNSAAYAWGHCNAWDGGDDLVLEGSSLAWRRILLRDHHCACATTGERTC